MNLDNYKTNSIFYLRPIKCSLYRWYPAFLLSERNQILIASLQLSFQMSSQLQATKIEAYHYQILIEQYQHCIECTNKKSHATRQNWQSVAPSTENWTTLSLEVSFECRFCAIKLRFAIASYSKSVNNSYWLFNQSLISLIQAASGVYRIQLRW